MVFEETGRNRCSFGISSLFFFQLFYSGPPHQRDQARSNIRFYFNPGGAAMCNPQVCLFYILLFWKALGGRNTQLLKHHIRLYPFDPFNFAALVLCFCVSPGAEEGERYIASEQGVLLLSTRLLRGVSGGGQMNDTILEGGMTRL